MIDLTSKDLLAALIAPRSVALIGASASEDKLTARPLTFLRRHGFAGQIFPVNPVRPTVMGLPAFATVGDIPAPVDHAYILLEAGPAVTALEECARAGVKVVSILADGFAEAGEAGRALQDRLAKIARDAGILLIGPNSTGVVATASGFSCTTNAAFRADRLEVGRLAVLSQSGSMIGTILSRGQARGTAFSTLISVGNEAAAGIGELGQLLLNDPGTDGFVLFLETIRDRAALTAFSEGAAALGKPVVAYMIGKSHEGQALSVSHTGALTGSARAVSTFLRDIGIREVEQFETLIDAPRVLSRLRPGAGRPRAVTVVSTTGGGGAMVVDQISARGVPIAGCSAAARADLTAQGMALGHGKLVDVTLAGTNYATMKKVVSTLLADLETGVLLVAIGSSARFNPDLAVRPIVDALAEAGPEAAPLLAFPLPDAPESLALLEAGGIPTFRNVETCAETVALLLDPPRARACTAAPLPDDIAALIAAAAPGVMNEVDSGAVFAALGAARPAQIVLTPAQALPDDLPFDFPVVAKIISADLPHKTEAGAIRINIPDRAALQKAIAQMQVAAEAHHPGYRQDGVLVQQMRRGLGEALIGITRDALVGPVITVGMGGVMTEIYRDTAVRCAPVSLETAREMLTEVKGFALFRGFRGKPLGDLEALAQTVTALSRLALCDLVEEAETNPILIEENGVVLLDALILRGADR
ncbi:CoA-binding protein [Frigidibacter albus]|uniref:CoA-binding protein n=1 Tax=Frigidibacter albus TaxID=1465486 RepID=A0A6L8VMN2_9RHOB|nr:acetate--CoA ligase family protein [Frigidibacter albus]MZQ91051.1 CoA-binding protein [Frigidibacter albus]NBE32936.1 CoA-binding protein [Frigidibacter albus]GGH62512.1 6-carboxyhexanoate--CoA ligase [Frigidibacter albus]